MSRPGRPIRRIACISTSRADAGIYRPLLRALAAVDRWAVCCLAGGTHLSAEWGGTLAHLGGLRGVRIVPVEHWSPGDEPAAVAAAAGRATGAFAEALSREGADFVFVLGDRAEMLAAALAATILRLPIAHLHGGDATAGAYDDTCRDAITKLSHLHFPALPDHARRIEAMGEQPWRIHAVGALALDELRTFTPMPAAELCRAVGVDFARPVVVVAFHPETLSDVPPVRQIDAVLDGVRRYCDSTRAAGGDANRHRGDPDLLLIGPNVDVGHAAVLAALRRFAADRPSTVLRSSLDQSCFWSCLAHAAALVGNSSAGIIEAPSFALPVVNVGNRQGGRARAANVLDAPFDAASIAAAIRRATSDVFRASLRGRVNPYGDGRAAERIVAVLQELPGSVDLLSKRF